MDGVSSRQLRIAQHFVNPGVSLYLPGVKNQLLQAKEQGKQVLILHKGSDGVLRATAGNVEKVTGANKLQLVVSLTGVRQATPLAVAAFVDKDLELAGGTKISSDEFNDLFPRTVDFVRCESLPGEFRARLFESEVASGLYDDKEARKLTELKLGYCCQSPRYIRLYTGDDLTNSFNPVKNS